MNTGENAVRKRICAPLYPKDILVDAELSTCSLATRGAYLWFLLQICYDNVSSMTLDLQAWSRFWRCSEDEARAVVTELSQRNPCDVTLCNEIVTLTNRRRKRLLKRRCNALARVRRYRARLTQNPPPPYPVTPCNASRNPSCNAPVTTENPPSPIPLPGKMNTSNRIEKSIPDTPSLRNTIARSLATASETTRLIQINDYADIHNPANDPILLALTLGQDHNGTRDKARNYYRGALARLGPALFRAILAELWGELKSGRIRRPGALLVSKLKTAQSKGVRT